MQNIFSVQGIVLGFYYGLLALIVFFSVFGIYAMLRYGKSRIFSLVVCGLYAFIFLAFLNVTQSILHNTLNF